MACYDPRDEGRERPKRNRGTTTSPASCPEVPFQARPWILHSIHYKGLLLFWINFPTLIFELQYFE